MPPLAETQTAIARAMITGDSRMAPSTLTGGADPRMRLAIHLRHYRTSLRTALEDKFPATVWLFGATFFRAAADAYVRECPPRTPCIAEYGRNFPEFIAGYERAAGLGYVEAFAKLEWLLGRASIALDQAPLAWDQLVSRGPDLLPNATLALQSGLGYLRAEQAVDQLMTLYLRDQEPASFELTACDAPIQVSGSRGSFRLERLTPGDFEFRLALSRGHSVNDAASRALETDERFDPGQALRELATAGLVISCNL